MQRKTGSIALQDITPIWLTDVRIRVKESTYTRYYRNVHRYILPHIGEVPLCKLDSLRINDFACRGRYPGQCACTENGVRHSLNAKFGFTVRTALWLCVCSSARHPHTP